MKEKKKTNPLLRLTLPAAAVQRLRKAGIYCTPSITDRISAGDQAACPARPGIRGSD